MSKRRPRPNATEHRMARALDELAEFEKFQEEILPVLKQAIAEQWNAERIWNHPKTQALLAARAVTIGVMDKDPARALSAIKDLFDRTVGKPKEKQEITHKMSKLKDEELDALLATTIQDLGEDDETLPN